MQEGKRVLIVAYLFPPIGGIGVQRAMKFAKYLVHHGWLPIVLTTEDAVSATMDEALLKEIPPEVEVVRVKDPLVRIMQRAISSTTNAAKPVRTTSDVEEAGHGGGLKRGMKSLYKRIQRLFLIPDANVLWALRTTLTANRLVHQRQIDAIYTTSSPVSAHLVGYLVRRFLKVPWVADFRDPWTTNMHFDANGRRAAIERFLERNVMTHCTALTTVTEGFRQSFIEEHPIVASKASVIRNGVDPVDFLQLDDAPASGKFTMLYAGILYPKRSPEVFLRALSQAIRSGRIHPDHIRIEFAGVFDYPGHTRNAELVERLHLGKVVKVLGYLHHDEIVKRMAKAHSLLLIGDNDPSAHLYVPGKLYEYLFTRRPIFALMNEGEASRLIRAHQAGTVVSNRDIQEVENALVSMVNQFQSSGMRLDIRPVPKELTREFQAGQLAKALNRACGAQKGLLSGHSLETTTTRMMDS